jgi:ketosteroid isomerase-like protein
MTAPDPDIVADRLFAAIEAGEIAAIEDMWADDVIVWHSGDEFDNERVRALKVIRWFVGSTITRRYRVLDRRVFDCGFVQQHVLHAVGRSGASIDLRVCIVVVVGIDGRITRIDEYFDPADMAPLLER